jgi:isopentenyldiphosphate isomerase
VQSAARGIEEELSVKPLDLQKIGERNAVLKEGQIYDNEKVEIFKAGFEGKIKLQKEEVKQGKWVSKQELLREMNEKPELFTPWLLEDKKFLESL